MKQYFKLILLCLLINSLHAQEDELIDYSRLNCWYDYTFYPDSLNLTAPVNIQMMLQIGQVVSRFAGISRILSDSLIYYSRIVQNTQETVDQFLRILQSNPGHPLANFTIYKNYPNNNDLIQTSVLANRTSVKVFDNEPIAWTVLNSNDTIILGYKCHKAKAFFRNRHYIAWYTPEIPVSDGPYKFRGLPGLIMLIKDVKNMHRFELVKISKSSANSPILYRNKKYVEMSPKGFVKALYDSHLIFYDKVQRNEAGITLGKEDRASMLRKIKSWNNYIEKF